jgi:hypothetical protein
LADISADELKMLSDTLTDRMLSQSWYYEVCMLIGLLILFHICHHGGHVNTQQWLIQVRGCGCRHSLGWWQRVRHLHSNIGW